MARRGLRHPDKVIDGEPPAELSRAMAAIESEIEAAPDAELVRSNKELDTAIANQRIAFVHTIEGAHVVPGDLDRIDELVRQLAHRGVASITLAHFYPNKAVPPAHGIPKGISHWLCRFDFQANPIGELSEFGEQLVNRMVENGIIVDLSHSPRPARGQVLDIVGMRAPVVATHTGVWELNNQSRWRREEVLHRSLHDDEILRIKETGGVVGVTFMNYYLNGRKGGRGLDIICETIQHIANVTGSYDYVGLGTDFDGFTNPPNDVRGPADLPKVAEKLLEAGVTEADVRKVMGENARRVLRQGWGPDRERRRQGH